jgi:hypothetical protein
VLFYPYRSGVENDDLFWGDEVEYAVLETYGQGEERSIKLALVGTKMMQELNRREDAMHNPSTNGCHWHQEYGSWMVLNLPSQKK